MTQTTNRFLDEFAKLMTDAAGAADGLKREVTSIMRAQGERVLQGMDVVQREEFEAVKAMAEKARATRAARHTMGKKQKLSIKGDVSQTAPANGSPRPLEVEPSQHRLDLRFRQSRRRGLPGHGTCRGRDAR